MAPRGPAEHSHASSLSGLYHYEYLCKFEGLRSKWMEKSIRAFDPEEIADIESATVVESQYGYSVCFFMRGGGQTYIPLDQNSSLSVGDAVDVSKAKIVTLGRAGEKDIYRVRA